MERSVVLEALREVVDPELGIDVVSLGLVQDVVVAVPDRRVEVALTMTSPACPLGDLMVGEAEGAIRRATLGLWDVEVRIVLEPPWNPSRMDEAARQALGWGA